MWEGGGAPTPIAMPAEDEVREEGMLLLLFLSLPLFMYGSYDAAAAAAAAGPLPSEQKYFR